MALGATVVAFACGSSSVSAIAHGGKTGRWVVLLLVLAVAALAARRARLVWVGAYAPALWLLAVATVSVAWSVTPRLSVERVGTLWLLFVAAGLVGVAVRGRLDSAERILVGLLAGAAAVGVAGLLLLAVDRSAALQPGSTGVPTRYRGLGENANTSALLFAVALPLATWALLRAGRRRDRALAAACFLLLEGSIVGSGSRGALVAGIAGSLVAAVAGLDRLRLRLAAASACAALLAAGIALGSIPQPLDRNPPVAARTPPLHPRAPYQDVEAAYPLEADIGRSLPGRGSVDRSRSLQSSSGRLDAWRGALGQAAQRPIAGYGFGTEERVFVDRYYYFAGGVPENSYIGMLLQVGAVGLVSFAVLVVTWLALGARRIVRAPARARMLLAGCGGATIAGLVAALAQSYLFSVGNVATATFWICAFVLAAASRDAIARG